MYVSWGVPGFPSKQEKLSSCGLPQGVANFEQLGARLPGQIIRKLSKRAVSTNLKNISVRVARACTFLRAYKVS